MVFLLYGLAYGCITCSHSGMRLRRCGINTVLPVVDAVVRGCVWLAEASRRVTGYYGQPHWNPAVVIISIPLALSGLLK